MNFQKFSKSKQNNYCYNCFRIIAKQYCPDCHFNLKKYTYPTYILKPGNQVSHFIIGKMIGKGGYAIVYSAYDLDLNINIAIKEFLPLIIAQRQTEMTHITPKRKHQKDYEKMLCCFLIEAKILIQLKGIPGVVEAKQVFQENNTAYLCMQRLSGETLAKRLGHVHNNKTQYRLWPEQSIKLWKSVLNIVHRLHQNNPQILHRDLTPSNIFLIDKRLTDVVLLDFGLAKFGHSNTINLCAKGAGTPGFAAPEQITGKGKNGPATDLYSLAATIYTTLTGETPPSIKKRMQGKNIKPLQIWCPELSPEVVNTLESCLKLDYDERPQKIDKIFIALAKQQSLPKNQLRIEAVRKNTSYAKPQKIMHAKEASALPKILGFIIFFTLFIFLYLGLNQ